MVQRGKTVAVLGGGIAGLSAAHHLVANGYRVTVFDQRGDVPDDLGGKARSYDDRTDDERRFGEHGFRFFPGFYRHVVATMAEIPTTDGPPKDGNVKDRLVAVPYGGFYARPHEPARNSLPARVLDAVTGFLTRMTIVLVLVWVLAACALWDVGAGPSAWWTWAAVPAAATLVQAVLVGLRRAGDECLVVKLPDGRRTGRHLAQALLLHLHRWARWVIVPGLLAVPFYADPIGGWPAVVVLAAAVWFYPVIATVTELWGLIGRVPLSVRPGILESGWACFRVGALVTSSRRRLYEQWEHESWWSYIGAYRFSRGFRLAFATGLTRSFVATRAESMSSRTGGTILAQLLFDVSSTLTSRMVPADQVLDGPTHETWIGPWVAHLRRRGVRFNEFEDDDGNVTTHRRVDVTRVLITAPGDDDGDDPVRVDGFEFLDPGELWLSPRPAPQPFDHYVLAVAGTAAQRIVANSPDLVRRDRGVPVAERPVDPLGDRRTGGRVPLLLGVLDLEFGWMSGIVFHLEQPVEKLPHGHLLCLESEWALTAIDQSRPWTARGRDARPWGAVISVNISDWKTPSPRTLPAHLEGLETVADETWRQLRDHVPELAHVTTTPAYVTDTAINDPTALAVAKGLPLPSPSTAPIGPATYENTSLRNDERLLINVAGSWDHRPTARTVFPNFTIAGDYVRTATDFASMEAADEAARRAVNVILEADGAEDRCEVADELEVPAELRFPTRVMRMVDDVAVWLHLPHPLTLIAAPCGWLAGGEVAVRRAVQNLRGRRRRRTP